MNNPWIDDETRQHIKIRKAIFEKEGRSANWKKMKDITQTMIANRKKKYYDGEVDKLRSQGADRIHYKILKKHC